ncbi:MAG: hypothetical protein AB1758_33150 [Candidatus Eremiobacterota bacterium]
MTVGTQIPYSQRKREAITRAIPRLAIDATDVYVAAATIKGLGQESGVMPFVSGGLAAFHVISAIMHANQSSKSFHTEVERKRLGVMAIGEAITGAGLGMLTFGVGLWALPVLALGEITTNYAQFA